MTTPTIESHDVGTWTLSAYVAHNEAMRHMEVMLAEERDRRYREVNEEREKALKIKEQADRDALELARQIQTYKDEKANELREQISRERGFYASKDDVQAAVRELEAKIDPLIRYMNVDQGSNRGFASSWGILVAVVGMLIGIGGAMLAIFR